MFVKARSFVTRKRVATTIVLTGVSVGTAYYMKKKHEHDKLFSDQCIYLFENPAELSGVYLVQRPPFGYISYLQWLLPYHQSLCIKMPDGTIRCVGLGQSPGTKFYEFLSQFVDHHSDKHKNLDKNSFMIPIEAWVDYYIKYGVFASGIDIQILNDLTKTTGDVNVVNFGSLFRDIDGSLRITTCRSEAMRVIYESGQGIKIQE